ncbi:Hypothetical_protein [Hexamita inflata]|uniref:Hypothetical_protein n=1 Tax=Hexamita inflata TaxID=28002 RepID=A0AA86RRJ6_9EUKA|nr:Hypothetical protein HINF_LOCUS65963 [Hexamita inflata]
MKYLQFNRETEQTSPRVVRLAFTSRLAHQKPPRRRPQKLTPARDRRRGAVLGTPWKCRELLVRSYYQFNTASYSKLRSEVWSGNLQSTALGDYARTGCAERFLFSRHLLSPSRQRGVQGAPAVSPGSGESRRPASQARIGRTKSNTAVAESAWE